MFTHHRNTSWGGALILLACSLIALSQTLSDKSSDESTPQPAPPADFCVLKPDPESGLIKAVSGYAPEYAYLNTPEKRQARYAAGGTTAGSSASGGFGLGFGGRASG